MLNRLMTHSGVRVKPLSVAFQMQEDKWVHLQRGTPEKGNMNVAGSLNEAQAVNVLPLFETVEVVLIADPLEELLAEAYTPDDAEEDEVVVERRRDLVLESHFPDQSMYVLDKQLQVLKDSLNRIKFYLGDIDDLLPR